MDHHARLHYENAISNTPVYIGMDCFYMERQNEIQNPM